MNPTEIKTSILRAISHQIIVGHELSLSHIESQQPISAMHMQKFTLLIGGTLASLALAATRQDGSEVIDAGSVLSSTSNTAGIKYVADCQGSQVLGYINNHEIQPGSCHDACDYHGSQKTFVCRSDEYKRLCTSVCQPGPEVESAKAQGW